MSNTNRAVTRTARAAHGTARHRRPRRAHTAEAAAPAGPERLPRRVRLLSPEQRVDRYRRKRHPERAGHLFVSQDIRLTGPQLRRAAKKAHRSLAEWDLVQALGEDYARRLGWEW